MPLLVDAEQTWLQPAIDGIVLNLSRTHNREHPIVYNTFQMYLKDSRERLDQYIAVADKEGHVPCVKLVRGAYMQSEEERCKENGRPYPVHESIEATHACYDDAAHMLIDRLDTCGVLIASHNQSTVEQAVEKLLDQGHRSDHPRIAFGQLYGMADHLSFALGSNSFNICKYVPFGPIREVIPYLTRRLEENASILGGTPYERSLLWKELKRRRVGFSITHN
jgi:proline dehydrogenase